MTEFSSSKLEGEPLGNGNSTHWLLAMTDFAEILDRLSKSDQLVGIVP